MPNGKAKRSTWAHRHFREAKLGAKFGEHALDHISLSGRSAARGNQQVRADSRLFEHRDQRGAII
ncbi:MAG: hypothetical protein WBE97_13410, partial [Candidatus Acidiferrales bacterium]